MRALTMVLALAVLAACESPTAPALHPPMPHPVPPVDAPVIRDSLRPRLPQPIGWLSVELIRP
jgi:hypothetical protein